MARGTMAWSTSGVFLASFRQGGVCEVKVYQVILDIDIELSSTRITHEQRFHMLPPKPS